MDVFRRMQYSYPHTSHKSNAWKSSIRKPASRKNSDSVELWDTDVCFLHIQLSGTNVRLPRKKHEILPDADFESSKSPAKSESWNKPNRQYWAVLPTWQHVLRSVVWWMQDIKRSERLWHALVHFVSARPSLFTDRRNSSILRQSVSILSKSRQLIDVLRSVSDRIVNGARFTDLDSPLVSANPKLCLPLAGNLFCSALALTSVLVH